MCEGIYSVLVYDYKPAVGEYEVVDGVLNRLTPSCKVVSPSRLVCAEHANVWHFYANGYPEEVIDFVLWKLGCGYEVIDLMTGERITGFVNAFGGINFTKHTFRTEMKKRIGGHFDEFVLALSEVTHK